jgi:general secretion pathway protein B
VSYILDALKKAESERERGVVPGLNTAQNNHSTYIHYASDAKPWRILALVLCVLLVAVAALWAWRQSAVGPSTGLNAPPPAATTPPLAPGGPIATAPALQSRVPEPLPQIEAKAPARAEQKPGLPVRAAVPEPVVAIASPQQPATSAVAHVQAKVAPPPASSTLPAALPVTAVKVEAPNKPTPMAAPIRSASGGVPALNELPDALKSQIPPLVISGAVYSEAPPEWTLIINDQLMGKGSQVTPDLRLEEISASSAVFNFKGQRFRMER